MPSIFLLGFCILLFVALVWICHSLKNDEHLMGNEKWMAVHLVLLTMVLGSYIWLFFANGNAAYMVYDVIDCIIYLLMAFIMD
jgi:heme A synthase